MVNGNQVFCLKLAVRPAASFYKPCYEMVMKVLVLFISLVFSTSAFSASFDCAKASTLIEKAICSDPTLGKLDEALANNYNGMLSADLGRPAKSIRNEQREWISKRNKCMTRDCLVSAYRERIDETCDYGVVSGVHPECVRAEDVEE